MEHKYFTAEEIEELQANKYTASCSGCTLKYTDEFKDLFMMRHAKGVSPQKIFRDCGYRVELLGRRRIENFYNRQKNTIRYSGKTSKEYLTEDIPSVNYSDMPPLKAIASMQSELTYLRQEVAFLKKIVALENQKKQGK